ncbi:MAG TPA: ECF transporter S component [bacterium]|jgi:riboflavin transporter FmnP|nr:ECF transporter S component [Dictyoglomota bacterium]HHV81207.1 ECF transporter S component [bacterium]HOK29394.1 ECF transporter S component [bacterium]HOL54504.1 ECF transporter S component [bacterium]HON72280.1 ECF transporter S component [bacterium]
MRRSIKIYVGGALLSAIGFILMLFQVPLIPEANFLLYDPGDVAVLLAGIVYGPWIGFLSILIKNILYFIIKGLGGPIGVLMNTIATGGFVIVPALILKYNSKILIPALLAGVAAKTLIMIPVNLVFTPMYTGLPVAEVWNLIKVAVIPFNIVQGSINMLLFLLIYGVLERYLKKMVAK